MKECPHCGFRLEKKPGYLFCDVCGYWTDIQILTIIVRK